MKKVIFITGTSTGFGKLMVYTLSKAGHSVIAGMRHTQDRNKTVVAELAALPNVKVVDIDIASDESVKKAFAQVGENIDVLVNNAAVAGYGLLEAYTIDQIKRIFEVNFYGVIRTIQAVLPSMRKARKGVIINLTSGASGHTLPFMIPYLASKFGVESITEGLQDELAQFGIENVSIQPGVYLTEMNTTKTGIMADKPEIAADYDPIATQQFAALGAGLFSKVAQFNSDPQVIADGVLKLIEMEDGTRPLRYPLDAIAQGTDLEFIEARARIKAKWLTKYSA